MLSSHRYLPFSCRLKKQLSEIESGSESSIMQSIEKNSARQQQAIRQVRLEGHSQDDMTWPLAHLFPITIHGLRSLSGLRNTANYLFLGLGHLQGKPMRNWVAFTYLFLSKGNLEVVWQGAAECLFLFQQVKGEQKSPQPLRIKVNLGSLFPSLCPPSTSEMSGSGDKKYFRLINCCTCQQLNHI